MSIWGQFPEGRSFTGHAQRSGQQSKPCGLTAFAEGAEGLPRALPDELAARARAEVQAQRIAQTAADVLRVRPAFPPAGFELRDPEAAPRAVPGGAREGRVPSPVTRFVSP